MEMNEELPATWPKTAVEIFIDFMGRHGGLVRALTADARQFYQQCDPEKDLLCLYGLPNGTWKVGPPAEEVPVNIPEPTLGINVVRDGASVKHWLSSIALHCDSWLISVAFYFGAFSQIKKIERDRLFQMINDYPTVLEIVLGYAYRLSDHFGTPNSSSEIKSIRKPRKRKTYTSVPMKIPMAPKKSRPPENHTSMRMKMPMAPKVSRQPVNYTSMPMNYTSMPMNYTSMPMNYTSMPMNYTSIMNYTSMPMNYTSMPMNYTSMPMNYTSMPMNIYTSMPMNYTSMPMKMPMAPKVSRQPVNYTSMPMKMPMAPKESQQPVNHISMPMMMTMAPKESRQPVNHISMPWIKTMAPKESRQPVNHISMPWIMTMAPNESRQPLNHINMPMIMTMAPNESRQPVNHISMPMRMTMAPKEHETRVEVHEGQDITVCGACGKKDGPGAFWICCDICDKWFHGLCVAITADEAEHVMHFKCRRCRGKQKQN